VQRFAFDEASDLDLLLFRQDHVISAVQARAFLTEAAIEHRIQSGRWQRLHRGVFPTDSGPVRYAHRLWCAVLACAPEAYLAGATAAAADGLARPPFVIDILIPLSRRVTRPPSGVALHRSSVLPRGHLHRMAQPPRTRVARSLVDAAQWSASHDATRALVADAFRRRLVGLDDLVGVLDQLPRAKHRRWIRQVAIEAAGGAFSLPELEYVRLGRRAGLPEPSRQVIRVDSRGHRRYLDVRYDEWRVAVEIDGGQHIEPAAWWADMRRQNDLWIAGERVLRFPAWAIRERPDEVIAQVRAALSAAGWLGRARSNTDLGSDTRPLHRNSS
jgi:hypothetical protein